jgi:hypothetical protein
LTHVTQATRSGSLTSHKQSKQKGKKYPCDTCAYLATTGEHLATHKQSKHDVKKYPCDSYDYQASDKHKQSRHKGKNIPVTHVTIRQLDADT